jgi:hypothetical protein
MMINRNVRGYFGVYTGKGVKPLENCEEILGDFENGDEVIVFNSDDFFDWYYEIKQLNKETREVMDRSLERLGNRE